VANILLLLLLTTNKNKDDDIINCIASETAQPRAATACADQKANTTRAFSDTFQTSFCYFIYLPAVVTKNININEY